MIKIKNTADCTENDVTPEPVYLERREFMRTGTALGLGLFYATYCGGLGAAIKVDGYKRKVFSQDKAVNPDDALTSFTDATNYNNFYEFGTNKTDPAKNATHFNTDNWQITVGGECEKKGRFFLQELIHGIDIEERIYRLRCVEAWSMVIPWLGVPLAHVLNKFKPNARAKYVAFKTLLDPQQMPGQRRPILKWPYVEGLRIDEAMHPLTFLAIGMYGRIMPNQNGAPVRLVVPWKYGFKGIKSIVSIRFTQQQPDTSWNLLAPNEYGFYSNVNPHVHHPRWDQSKERRIGEFFRRKTLLFNGYADQVAQLYTGMDLKQFF